jgi:trimeric autotransporter adhesin
MLACFASSEIAQAVTPAPDGGYANANTAEGEDALFSLTDGSLNTALGNSALYNVTTGSNNTAVDASALYQGIGNSNTAVGVGALAGSAFSGNSGNYNTGVGDNSALVNNGPASANTALGYAALANNIQGANNTATGYTALYSNSTGTQNTANGVGALYTNNFGNYNTATGLGALHANYSGNNNTANGINALLKNTTADGNTGLGANALQQNTTGAGNTGTGFNALLSNKVGNNNVTAGVDSLEFSTSGNNNIGVGANSGFNLTTGSNNIDIGNGGVAGESAKIRIGKQGTQNGTFIAGIYGIAVTGSPVVVNSGGKLGVGTTSSARFKQAIKPMERASEAILSLKPVTFRYKEDIDPDGIRQFGLVAEDVEKVNPDLVARDEEGKGYTVRYEAVNAMLLNEFLKEHRKVEEQEATIRQLSSIVAEQQKVFTARLNEQDAKIKAVNERLYAARQLVADNQ